jgi:LysR family transcriptional regulator, cell division regulator
MDPRILPDVMVFLEVLRAGSLTRAAARLNTVQSNVTARIKKLEEALGVPLLKRHARGIKATPAGEAALAMALRMDSVLDDLRFTFGREAKRVAKLRIGAIETVAASHLPAVVGRFVQRFPQIDLSVQTGSSAAQIKQLKEGDLDVAFVSRPPQLAGFREQVAFNDELVVVAPASFRSLAAIFSEPAGTLKVLVQRLGCSYTERLLALLAEKSTRNYRLLELGTLEGILGFVEAGVGIAAMPRAFVRSVAGSRSIALIALPRGIRQLETFLVAPSSHDASSVVNEFVSDCAPREAKAERVAPTRLR